jgi:hypothetical protein
MLVLRIEIVCGIGRGRGREGCDTSIGRVRASVRWSRGTQVDHTHMFYKPSQRYLMRNAVQRPTMHLLHIVPSLYKHPTPNNVAHALFLTSMPVSPLSPQPPSPSTSPPRLKPWETPRNKLLTAPPSFPNTHLKPKPKPKPQTT